MNLLRLVFRLPACLLFLLLVLTAIPALAAEYDLPSDGSDVIGKVQHIKTKASDTFVALANKYDVGYREMREANPDVDPWLPGDGTPIVIPTAYILPNVPRKGVVINIPEMRVYYFPPKGSKNAGKVFTFPVGIGRQGWSTPITHTHISQKIPHPSWTPPASIKKEHAKRGDPLPDVVPAGPDNPLGQYALRLGIPSYLMHGTNKPSGIGMRVSHGCIRLFPKDISKLFSMVSVGTPVNIIDAPYKVGWDGDTLKLEAHPPTTAGGDSGQSYTPWVQALIAATQDNSNVPINWAQAQKIVHNPNGIPQPISTGQNKTTGAKTQTARKADRSSLPPREHTPAAHPKSKSLF